ncbi:hypothetical protein NP493_368g02030 [Ridgeia piscesae]|uniref:Uncharacterized protein n=1 Tax=Ridgeia piscesae TaxID=27915 RepID=A0AAD9L2L7_RIDPI|nr:hypothetical protein NP493_368g02030 [Ridgeia piscesae]
MIGVLRGAITRVGARSTPLVVQKCGHGIISGPPRVKISFTEKMVSMVILFACLAGPSFYIMSQFTNYRRLKHNL